MATILPAINFTGMRVTQDPENSFQVNNSGNQMSKVEEKKVVVKVKRKKQINKDQEVAVRKEMVRAQLPLLSIKETIEYRSTYKKNLCVDMLREGFHKAFTQLHSLIEQQNEARNRAGPESALWNQAQLQDELEKLDTLRKHLCEAEAATRIEQYGDVYSNYYQLARYFQSCEEDKWLSDHFFAQCLITASCSHEGGGLRMAEGHVNLGLALEKCGDISGAIEHLQVSYDLSKDNPDWETTEKTPLHKSVCAHMVRVYTTLANQSEKDGDTAQYLRHLKVAYDRAIEGGNGRIVGEASFRLGVAHYKNGDPETALGFLLSYLQTCKNLDDKDGMGQACEAIAKALEAKGRIEECIKYLEMYAEIADRAKDDRAISRAYRALGIVFNALGRYDQAVDYFNKSFAIARTQQDTEMINSARSLAGVAAAHKMLRGYSAHVEVSNRLCVNRLQDWKDGRNDEFDKPIEIQREELKEEVSNEETTIETADDDANSERKERDDENSREELRDSTTDMQE